MQSYEQHQKHHLANDRDELYSIMINYTSTLFASINYWKNLEAMIDFNWSKSKSHCDEESYDIYCHKTNPDKFGKNLDILRRQQFPQLYQESKDVENALD